MFNSARSAGKYSVPVDSNPHAANMGATSLLENDVYSVAGKRIGKIEEIIFDTHTGCVRYVVVALGGIIAIGRKRVAIPWSALTPDPNFQRCVLDMTLLNLTGVPVFDNDPWLQRTFPTQRLESPLQLYQGTQLGRDSHRID